jgi:hypothetical protein
MRRCHLETRYAIDAALILLRTTDGAMCKPPSNAGSTSSANVVRPPLTKSTDVRTSRPPIILPNIFYIPTNAAVLSVPSFLYVSGELAFVHAHRDRGAVYPKASEPGYDRLRIED